MAQLTTGPQCFWLALVSDCSLGAHRLIPNFLLHPPPSDSELFDRLELNKMRTFVFMDIDRVILNSNAQLAGLGLLSDLADFSSKHMYKLGSKQEMKLETKVWQVLSP